MSTCQEGAGTKKKIGKALMGLAGLTAAGSYSHDKEEMGTSLLGSAVLGGIGYALYHADSKKKKGSGVKLTHTMISKHKLNKPLHISEMKMDARKAKKIAKALADQVYHPMSGEGLKKKARKLKKKLSKAKHKAVKETISFLNGEKAVKPSTVALGLSAGLGVAAMVPSPVSAQLGLASKVAGVSGKALQYSGRGVAEIPLAGQGLSPSGAGLHPSGGGLYPAGQVPASYAGGGFGDIFQKGPKGSGKRKAIRRNKKYGSRDEVFKGMAQMTRGGLRKADLMMSGQGKIISRKKHMMGKGLANMYSRKKTG